MHRGSGKSISFQSADTAYPYSLNIKQYKIRRINYYRLPDFKWVAYICFFLMAIPSEAQTFVFAQLNGSPLNTAGWNLQGGAMVGNVTGTGNQELIVCPTRSQSGAIFYNQPLNLTLCNKWKAEFDFRMFDGTGADGLAFCFLEVPPVGFVSGAGLGIPLNANGLKICFDTWNNCIPFNAARVHDSMPKIEIRYGLGYTECSSQPTISNSAGSLSFINSASYHHAFIQYDNGNITVSVDGTVYLTGFQVFNFAGYLGFTASTGGYYDTHSIKNVIIYTDMPPSVAGAAVSICPNDAAQLGTQPNPAYQYAWTSSAGLNATDIANPVARLDNTGTDPLIKKYYVRTSFPNTPGCSSVDSVTVTVNPKPKIAFIVPAICLKDAFAQFNDSSYTGNPKGYPFVFNWNFGDPNANTANPNTSRIQNPAHIYSAAQNYPVQLKVTSADGCKDSLLKIFTVNGAFPKVDFTVVNSSSLCSNNEVSIQNLSTVNFGNITKAEIVWDFDNFPTNLVTDSFPALGKLYRHQYPVFYGTLPKKFQIKMRAYSGQSCMDEIKKEIILYPPPSILFNSLPGVCENIAPFLISGAYDSSKNNGRGYFKGSGIDSSGLFSPQIANVGKHSLTYVFTTTNGCSDSAKKTISVWPLPEVHTGKQIVVLEGGSAILPATATGNGLQYVWSPSQFLNDSTILQPRSTPLSDILYTLKATTPEGCMAMDTVSVKILQLPLIPNAFSPNGDGINDQWEIKYLDSYPDCTVEIYNRTGQLLFQSVGYSSPWNGTFHGYPVPVGTYYYIINPKSGRKLIAGSVTVIR